MAKARQSYNYSYLMFSLSPALEVFEHRHQPQHHKSSTRCRLAWSRDAWVAGWEENVVRGEVGGSRRPLTRPSTTKDGVDEALRGVEKRWEPPGLEHISNTERLNTPTPVHHPDEIPSSLASSLLSPGHQTQNTGLTRPTLIEKKKDLH